MAFVSGTVAVCSDRSTRVQSSAVNLDCQDNVILDTNTWLDWLLFDDNTVAAIRQRYTDKTIRLIATLRMRDELALVIARPQFQKLFTETRQPDWLMAEFDSLVELVPAPPALFLKDALPHPLICKDPDDQIFIDLALSSSPCILVSKDKMVLAVAKRLKKWLLAQGAENRPQVIICRPSEFTTLPL
jgi:putative PIN family toxin of toxin-antitoxin system